MDQLVADGKLREKVYGKQKVYVVNQVGFLLILQSSVCMCSRCLYAVYVFTGCSYRVYK